MTNNESPMTRETENDQFINNRVVAFPDPKVPIFTDVSKTRTSRHSLAVFFRFRPSPE
jgi:hypothetical protein